MFLGNRSWDPKSWCAPFYLNCELPESPPDKDYGLGWQGLIILMEVAAFTTDRTIQHSSTASILVRHGEFLPVDASGVN